MSTITKLGSGGQIATRSIFKTIFFIAIYIAGAVLTFMFGFNYLGPAFGNAIIGGFFALLLFDLGAVGWANVRRNKGLSANQRGTATTMMWVAAISAVIVSVLQMVLGSSLAPITDQTRAMVGQGGIWLLGLVGAAHFLCYFFFSQEAYDVKIEEAEEALDRSLKENRLVMLQKVRAATIAETNEILMGDVQPLARKEAAAIRREFLQEFNSIESDLGATAGAKKGPGGIEDILLKPLPSAATNPDCSCGMPIGTGEGFCDFELGGAECMIDAKAEEERATRAAEEEDNYKPIKDPIDLGK